MIHPLAKVESLDVGQETRVWAYAHILKGAKIGRSCNVGEGTFIESEVQVGDNCTIKNGVALWNGVTLENGVFVGPSASFTNDLLPRAFKKDFTLAKTIVRKGASIGANATIVCGIEIGAFALIAAGSVVTKDVPPHALVMGNPGKIVGRVCFCATRLEEGEYCPSCKKPLAQLSAPL